MNSLEEVKNDIQILTEMINDNTEEYLKFEDALRQMDENLVNVFKSIDLLNTEISSLKEKRIQDVKCNGKCHENKVEANCNGKQKLHRETLEHKLALFLAVFFVALGILIGKLIL